MHDHHEQYFRRREGKKRLRCYAILLCFTIAIISFNINFHLRSFSLSKKMEKESSAVIACLNSPSKYCEIKGDIRIEAESSTIVVVTHDHHSIASSSNSIKSWIVEPYPRTGTKNVKNWTINLVQHKETAVPECTKHHTLPSILFSLGGFISGNFFHDFADVLFPLYLTSYHFKGEVQFLATDYQQWWVDRFKRILDRLTRYKIMDIDEETSQVHCYAKLHIGLVVYDELTYTTNSPMHNFRRLLRQVYSLERETVIMRPRPRLMIMSRRNSATRLITNIEGLTRMATRLGFEVVVGDEGKAWRNLTRFVQGVNSCDAMVGVHGAGLTNMLFLPDNAVLIQLVPWGGGDVDYRAKMCYGSPAVGMKLRYLEYNMTVEESSLIQRYPMDHPILTNPELYNTLHGKDLVYLSQQNVTVDLGRLSPILAEALNLLRPFTHLKN